MPHIISVKDSDGKVMSVEEIKDHILRLADSVDELHRKPSKERLDALIPTFVELLGSLKKSPHIPMTQRIQILSLLKLAYGETYRKSHLLEADFFLEFSGIYRIDHLPPTILLCLESMISALADLPPSPEREIHLRRLIDMTSEGQKHLFAISKFIDDTTKNRTLQ